jgi:hypothetical protein
MTEPDFKVLNAPGLLARYSNPPQNWPEIVRAFVRTQLQFFAKEGLVRSDAKALHACVDDAVLMWSDLEPEGKLFLRTGAVDNWLASCDRKATIEAYQDASGLAKRLKKLRSGRSG